MENDQSKTQADILAATTVIEAIERFIASNQTGQLTFHFSNGILRQIQRNVFETLK